jgi:hypothetical protein
MSESKGPASLNMPGPGNKLRFFRLGIFLLPFLFVGCGISTEPDSIFLDTPIDIEVREGANGSDTVQANFSVRVFLNPEDGEVPTPLRQSVAFSVPGEDCGEAQTPLVISDENDEASTVWSLGTLTQFCTMEVRALAPSGTLLGFVAFDVTIEPGQPDDGWLPAGEVVRGVDTLLVSGDQYSLVDRFGNPLPWRFTAVNGPAVVLGEDLEDPRSRTLVATADGPGTLEITTRFGTYLQAAFNVCIAEDQRWIRVFRTEDADAVLAICP